MSLPLSANFGAGQTGLATVGYALLNADGTTAAARTIVGVAELAAGSGAYRVDAPEPAGYAGGFVLWDTGGGAPKFASSAIPPLALLVEPGINALQALRGMAAMLLGNTEGAGTGSEKFKAAGDPGTTRVTADPVTSAGLRQMTLNL